MDFLNVHINQVNVSTNIRAWVVGAILIKTALNLIFLANIYMFIICPRH